MGMKPCDRSRSVRILAVLHRSEIGGTEVSYGRLLDALATRDDVRVFGLYPEGSLVAEWAPYAPWAPYRAGMISLVGDRVELVNWWRDARRHSREIDAAIRRFEPDVVLDLTSVLTAPVAAARRCRVPCVSYVREYVQPKMVRDLLWSYLARGCDALIPVSAPLAEDLERFAPDRTFLVRDGVPIPAQAERSVGAERIVAFFGGYERLKGGDVFIEAIPAIAARLADVSFRYYGAVLPGQEWFRDEVLRRAAAVDAQVEFVLTRAFSEGQRAATVVVMPSRHEGLGLVALESMSVGVPVVASRVGGLVDAVTDGATGLLVPPEDPTALAAAVSDLLSNGSRLAAMGEAARADMRARFSIEASAEGLMAVLERVIAKRSDARR
jgi:glycosyltransferase involved in cell wall biosynthesis